MWSKKSQEEQQKYATKPTEVSVMPWYIVAGNDGLRKDCILVGSLGPQEELLSVRLYLSEKAMEEQ